MDRAVQGVPANLDWFLKNRRDLVDSVIHPLERREAEGTYLLTIVDTGAAAPAHWPCLRRTRVPVALYGSRTRKRKAIGRHIA